MNNLLKAINTRLTSTVLPLPVTTSGGAPFGGELRPVGNEITFYPTATGAAFIEKGYNLNDAIYSIVSKNAEKCSQVRLYHTKIKRNERKTLQEYNQLHKYNELTKGALSRAVLKELRIMRKAMIEDLIVDSKLSRLLDKPNRFQTQSEWIEQLVGFKELTGEGNILLNRGMTGGAPLEMFVIPKPQLYLVINSNDPWEVSSYVLEIEAGTRRPVAKEDLIMWKYQNYLKINDPEHLRGQAPLESARILMQGMNEADERVAISNKNAGASGMLYSKSVSLKDLDPTKAQDMRRQVNNAVNNADMAGKIALLGGEWGYINFGLSVSDLKILEQYNLGFDRLCHVFKTPPGIFDANGTWDNQKQFERKWIFSKVAPIMYQLRSLLDDRLVEAYDLDPETNIVDCDVMQLQELSEDIKEQVDAIKEAYWLSFDEKRQHVGYEPLGTPEGQQFYLPSGLTTLSEMNMQTGGSLDNELNDLTL